MALRRCRKALLRDLSTYVKASKHLQGLLNEDEYANIPGTLDDVVNKAFRVVNRGVKLNDVSNYLVEPSSITISSETRLPTPPIESDRVLSIPTDTTSIGPSSSKSSPFDVDNVLSKIEPLGSPLDLTVSSKSRAQSALAASTRSSLQLSQSPYRPRSCQVQTGSARYRFSHIRDGAGPRRDALFSEQLLVAHDTFLGCIGAFIGLHLHSRSSSELHLNTAQAVKACHTLLNLIDGLWERNLRRSQDLRESREALRSKVSELVYTTKEIFSKDPMSGEQLFVVDDGKKIVSAATNCVRSAADCVAKAKLIVERIGDYEVKNNESPTSGRIGEPQKEGLKDRSAQRPQEQRSSKISNRNKEVSNFSRANIKITAQSLYTAPEPLEEQQQPKMQDVSHKALNSLTGSSQPSSSQISPITIDSDVSLVTICEAQHTKGPNDQPAPSSRRTSDSHDATTASTKSCAESVQEIGSSEISSASTRATSPDSKYPSARADEHLALSFSSASDFQSVKTGSSSDLEDQLLGKSYIHELVYSKDGQIAGGSLPAFVEQLTTHDSTPDATFVNAFYLTFRLFATPMELATTLINRYKYIGDYPALATPVRLRVYNVLKGWMESHWNAETDMSVLGTIREFANEKLCEMWPAAANRLVELASRLSSAPTGSVVPRCPTAMGRSNAENYNTSSNDNNLPTPIISRAQLSALRNFRNNGSSCSILNFDPLELARQFTIIESRIFCSIRPDELLALEWTKKSDSKATNVRSMSTLSTDLANLVADTILQPTEAKRRALVIKQWVKIAMKCLDLNNYDSLMAIICSLNSSMILRLKRTWEVVSAKTKTRLEELRNIVDVGRNYAVLRQRLQNQIAPCIPFVGIYLTDLTFVDVGNQTTRKLPGQGTTSVGEGADDHVNTKNGGAGLEVINFDKHMRTAKIIGQLQRFQIPHRLAPVPEMQEWMDYQIMRVRNSEQANVQGFYRRSLLLEPREPAPLSGLGHDQGQGKTQLPSNVAPATAESSTDGSSVTAGVNNAAITVSNGPPKDGSKLERFGLQFLSINASKDRSGS